jgi:hypothetical protein
MALGVPSSHHHHVQTMVSITVLQTPSPPPSTSSFGSDSGTRHPEASRASKHNVGGTRGGTEGCGHLHPSGYDVLMLEWDAEAGMEMRRSMCSPARPVLHASNSPPHAAAVPDSIAFCVVPTSLPAPTRSPSLNPPHSHHCGSCAG